MDDQDKVRLSGDIKANAHPAQTQATTNLTQGDTHAIEARDGVRLYTLGEVLYLEVEDRATVVHPEHHPITLLPGRYQIDRVREFDYLSHEARPVRD